MLFPTTAKAASIALALLPFLANAAAVATPKSSISPDGYHSTFDESTHQTFTNPDGTVVHFALTASSADKSALALHGGAKKPTRDLTKRSIDDNCGDSSFVNHSSGGSPTVADCQCIVNWARDPANDLTSFKFYASSPGDWQQQVWCGTCTFGVQTANIVGTFIGITDIGDLVQDSIARFQWNGLVGAEGNMGCWNALWWQQSSVNWAVFHR